MATSDQPTTTSTPAPKPAPRPPAPPAKKPPAEPGAKPGPAVESADRTDATGGAAPAERAIAVKAIAFMHGHKADLPGKPFAPGLTAGDTKSKQAHYRITYYPDRRHHLVEHVRPGHPVERRWVPETWCSWEPA